MSAVSTGQTASVSTSREKQLSVCIGAGRHTQPQMVMDTHKRGHAAKERCGIVVHDQLGVGCAKEVHHSDRHLRQLC